MNNSGIGAKVLLVVGVLLMLGSIDLIITYIGEVVTHSYKYGVSEALGLIAFLIGLVFVGYKMMKVQLNDSKALRELKEEQLILNSAKGKGGSLSVSDAALDCRIRIADTKKAFERLALTGICQVDVSDAGELFYRFPTFEKKQISEQK